MHPDATYDAANRARDELIRNTKEAAKMQRMLNAFGVDLREKKIVGIKHLRDALNIGLKEAKDAWDWPTNCGPRNTNEVTGQQWPVIILILIWYNSN